MKSKIKYVIPEFNEVISKHRLFKIKCRKALRDIKDLEKKYYFLDRIVEPRKDTDTKDNDTELEIAVMHLFQSLNFQCEKPQEDSNVDVKAKFKSFYFGIEVKNGNYVGENESIQPFKHKILNQENYHPILIYNNAKTKASWDKPRIQIANGIGYGILLTTELVKAYEMLKTEKLAFKEFLFMLSLKGEIKFSRKFIDRAYKATTFDEGQHKEV